MGNCWLTAFLQHCVIVEKNSSREGKSSYIAVALGCAGVTSDVKCSKDTTGKVEKIPNRHLEVEPVRETNQLLQIKAGYFLREKRIREFTDIEQANHILEAELENLINSIQAGICGVQCTINHFTKAMNW